MITLPDINEMIRDLNGELFPFGWAKLLWRLRKPRTRRSRVPLMGVAKKLHQSRLASQLAFMLIEYTRRDCVGKFGINDRRVRLDPGGQQGNAVDRPAAQRQGQPPLPDFREGASLAPPYRKAMGRGTMRSMVEG